MSPTFSVSSLPQLRDQAPLTRAIHFRPPDFHALSSTTHANPLEIVFKIAF